jgi:hypothetical protein
MLFMPILLLFALCAAGFEQTPADVDHRPYTEQQAAMLGLMRTINTFEYSDFSRSGSYDPWPVLLERNSSEFREWLARFGTALGERKEVPAHFAGLPEVIPGWKLRLNVTADGHGFTALLEDAHDKNGFAFVTDERGIIRESKYIY